MRKIIILTAVLLLAGGLLAADQYYLDEGDYRVNVPVEWTPLDASNLQDISFIAPDQSTILQISWYEGERFDQVNDMYRYFADSMGAEGDRSLFPYLEWQAILADLTFQSGADVFRGWFLFLDGERYDYQVMVFSPQVDYERTFPYILSCLDSFSPGEDAARHPGVISKMFYDPGNAAYEKKTSRLSGKDFEYEYDSFELEASQTVIEREAPLLTAYQSGSPQAALAWDRYYKLIYRDNYTRFEPVYRSLAPLMEGKTSEEIARELLAWLQGFSYGSSGTFSDLLSPLASLVQEKGDCDSLALAYLILLEYFDIDGILIVSETYSHAMAAINKDVFAYGGGFSLAYGEDEYYVAEMTKEVGIGMIASDMVDPAQWQPISFRDQ